MPLPATPGWSLVADAALRIGFRFEGIQDAHYIVKGRRRDTAWFRLLADEWPEVRAGLESQLYGPR